MRHIFSTLSVFIMSWSLQAQTSMVSVAGVVIDQDGKRAKNVKVILSSTNSNHKSPTAIAVDRTNDMGVYNLSSNKQVDISINSLYIHYNDQLYDEKIIKVELAKAENQVKIRKAKCSDDLKLYRKGKKYGKAETIERTKSAVTTEAYCMEIFDDYEETESKSNFTAKTNEILSNYDYAGNDLKGELNDIMLTAWYDLETLPSYERPGDFAFINGDFLTNTGVQYTGRYKINNMVASGYIFRVLANKGENKIKRSGRENLIDLKTGTALYPGDELISSSDSYVGLIHNTGKTIEVRSSSTNQIADLERKIKTGESSVASKYAEYIANKMNEISGENAMATGAVSRAGQGWIDVLAPNQSKVLGDATTIPWATTKALEGDTFVVRVTDIYGQEVYTTETQSKQVELDLTQKAFSDAFGRYYFTVASKNRPEITSNKIGIVTLSSEESDRYKDDLKKLENEVSEDSPLNKVIFASFYEDNGLILDACAQYEKAIEMSPDIKDFKEMYEEFLLRNGLQTREMEPEGMGLGKR